MRALKLLAGFSLALGLVVVAPGCNDDDDPIDPPNNTPDAGPGPGPGPQTITAFVRELILTQTAENNEPTTTEDKTLAETEARTDFPAEFFQ